VLCSFRVFAPFFFFFLFFGGGAVELALLFELFALDPLLDFGRLGLGVFALFLLFLAGEVKTVNTFFLSFG
jgi:hypothetical protein